MIGPWQRIRRASAPLVLAGLPLVGVGCDALESLAQARDRVRTPNAAELRTASTPEPAIAVPTRFVPFVERLAAPQPGLELDALVMAHVDRYPSDGTFAFHWPGPDWRGEWAGTTRDLAYRGEVIAHADDGARTHCCGVTFEVALDTLTDAYDGPVPGLSAMDAYRMRLGFCGDDKSLPRERLVVDALSEQGLGTPLSHDDARAGDFVQLWRRDGSGHSAVFIAWLYDEGGEREGIQYWSSQAATGGIGYHVERFAGRRGIDRKRVHFVRLHTPFDARAQAHG
ncbi:MAG: hypothetical protein AAF721_33375 [Myxococcota bacterium]